MKKILFLLLLGSCFLTVPAQGQLDLFLKARGTGFGGTFGEHFSGVGYDLGATYKALNKPWAGGLHVSRAVLEEIPASSYNAAVAVHMNHYNLHYGVRNVWNVVYPYAYAVAGFRTVSYKEAQRSESDPLFNSLSLAYGLKSGLQIGGKRWRGELGVEYSSGSPARYLSQETFARAAAANKEVQKVAHRSSMSSLTVGVGVVYVINVLNKE